MVNKTMMLRSLIVATFVALLTVLSAQNTSAQPFWPCTCGFVTVSSSSDIQCKFTLCVESALGDDCQTIIPGTQQFFKCEKFANPWIKDCNGNKVYITANCDKGQTQVIAISHDCCVEACVTTDSKGCLVVKVWAHSAPCDKCP